MGYRSAARSFQVGLGMGQRAGEFAQLQGLREKEEKRREWEHGQEKEKAEFEAIKKTIDAAGVLVDADPRAASKMVIDAYNSKYPDGKEARVIYRSDNPTDEIFRDGKIEGNIVLLSQKGGLKGFKDEKELIKFAAGNLKYSQFAKDKAKIQSEINKFNATSKIEETREGAFKTVAKLGKGGAVEYEKVEVDPGQVGLTEMEKKGAAAQRMKLGKHETGAALDTHVKVDPYKQSKLGDEKSAASSKAVQERLKSYKQQLSLLATDFTKESGAMLISDEGDITKAGKSASDKAQEIIIKFKKKEKLTDLERTKVANAKSFLAKIEEIRQYISDLPKYERKEKTKTKKGKKKKDWRDLRTKQPTGLRLQGSREYNK